MLNLAYFPHQGFIESPTIADYRREADLFREEAGRVGGRDARPFNKRSNQFEAIARRMEWTPKALEQMRVAA